MISLSDLIDMPINETSRPTEKRRKKATAASSSSRQSASAPSASATNDDTNAAIVYAPAEEGACPHCFLKPCIADANATADFLGRGAPPRADNNAMRRPIYKLFWKQMRNCNGWIIKEYIEKKLSLGGSVNDPREVMPACVLSLVRGKYPNLPSQQYMGHMWMACN